MLGTAAGGGRQGRKGRKGWNVLGMPEETVPAGPLLLFCCSFGVEWDANPEKDPFADDSGDGEWSILHARGEEELWEFDVSWRRLALSASTRAQ